MENAMSSGVQAVITGSMIAFVGAGVGSLPYRSNGRFSCKWLWRIVANINIWIWKSNKSLFGMIWML